MTEQKSGLDILYIGIKILRYANYMTEQNSGLRP